MAYGLWPTETSETLENLGEWAIASHGKGTHPSKEVTNFTTFLLCCTWQWVTLTIHHLV